MMLQPMRTSWFQRRSILGGLLGVLLIGAQGFVARAEPLTVAIAPTASPRVRYGVERLVDALDANGYSTVIAEANATGNGDAPEIVVGASGSHTSNGYSHTQKLQPPNE